MWAYPITSSRPLLSMRSNSVTADNAIKIVGAINFQPISRRHVESCREAIEVLPILFIAPLSIFQSLYFVLF